MNDRIDHATRALQLSRSEYSDPRTDTAVAIQTEALVHATLALVEQQRISNLIALAGLEMNGPLRHLVVQPHGDFFVDVRQDIATALGIETEDNNDEDV